MTSPTKLAVGALALTALLIAPHPAHADGCSFPRIEKAQVEMADQRAIIHFDAAKGEETLIIDTQIKPVQGTAAGAVSQEAYAWVVPLPNVPTEVKGSTVGALDTLQSLTAPRVETKRALNFVGVWLFGIALVLAAMIVNKKPWLNVLMGFALFLCVTCLCLIPTLGAASGGSGSESTVTLHRQETIGAYDTAVLTGEDGAAVTAWLKTNGYAIPPKVAPVMAQLAKEKWCFVAMKLHDSGTAAHPHPMKFVFPAKQAVYPMRLTGAGQTSPLTVDLFVLGDQEAEADGFHSGCAVASRPNIEAEMAQGSVSVSRRGLGDLPLAHPALLPFSRKTSAVTWLRGTVPISLMDHDLHLSWKPLDSHQDFFYTTGVAALYGCDTALVIFVIPLLWVAELIRTKRWNRIKRTLQIGVGIALLAGVGVFAGLPKTKAASDGLSWWHMSWAQDYGICVLGDDLNNTPPATVRNAAWVDSVVKQAAQQTDGDRSIHQMAFLLHEGDSPLGYTVQGEGDSLKVYFHDLAGMQHLIWPVPEKQ